jgi:hypothetical protein
MEQEQHQDDAAPPQCWKIFLVSKPQNSKIFSHFYFLIKQAKSELS